MRTAVIVAAGVALMVDPGCGGGGCGGKRGTLSDLPPEVASDIPGDPGNDGAGGVAPETGPDTHPPPDTPGPSIRVATFNAGLAYGFVEHADLRFPLLGPALEALDADVVCLQEVWTNAHAETLSETLKDVYPYQYREVTTDEGGNGGAACTTQELNPLAACAAANCADTPPADLGTCVLGKCGVEFGAISPGCRTCLASQLGKPLDEIVAACTAGSGGQYAYEGRNGVLVLSRLAVQDTAFTRFESYLNVRVALHVLIQDGGVSADVFCTHLTADLGDVACAGTYASWGEEQGAQVDALLQWVDGRRSQPLVVVAGDFNSGPDHAGGIVAEHPENYQKVVEAGYADPYLDSPGATCTWCGDNPLVGGGPSTVIDHVFVRGTGFQFESRRILDEPVTLRGVAEPSRLSDHYGVEVEITVPAR